LEIIQKEKLQDKIEQLKGQL